MLQSTALSVARSLRNTTNSRLFGVVLGPRPIGTSAFVTRSKHSTPPGQSRIIPLIRRRHLTTDSPSKSANNGSQNKESQTWLQRFLGPKPMPPRNTMAWYKEIALICTVFGITGSSTMMVSIGVELHDGWLVSSLSKLGSHHCQSHQSQVGPASRQGYSGIGRYHEGWSLVLPYMLVDCHVSHLRRLACLRGHIVWSPYVLSLLCRQDLFSLWRPTRDVG